MILYVQSLHPYSRHASAKKLRFSSDGPAFILPICIMNSLLFLALVVVVCLAIVSQSVAAKAAKKPKVEDPKECEVCIENLEKIDMLIPSDKKADKLAIEKATGTHCTLSGFGSEWKPNPNLVSPKDVKMCYIFEPIKKSISTPFATGMPKKKVCQRLKKENPEICEIKYRKY